MLVLGRIIPALAGNTFPMVVWQLIGGDHPRSRGEYTLRTVALGGYPGSSPLSRGILLVTAIATPAAGIIPALAGNTWSSRVVVATTTDHPRSRGEYADDITITLVGAGSSPLSRGILSKVALEIADRGIIPALAGNTLSVTGGLQPRTDHPRSRGEYAPHAYGSACSGGSSPLSRGILDTPLTAGAHLRIIPALAGNTVSQGLILGLTADHPRSRGEYRNLSLGASKCAGSSPLSRGIRSPFNRLLNQEGIIPALAGNTIRDLLSAECRRDHPRSRGEYTC